jgi:hypothetical protein
VDISIGGEEEREREREPAFEREQDAERDRDREGDEERDVYMIPVPSALRSCLAKILLRAI